MARYDEHTDLCEEHRPIGYIRITPDDARRLQVYPMGHFIMEMQALPKYRELPVSGLAWVPERDQLFGGYWKSQDGTSYVPY